MFVRAVNLAIGRATLAALMVLGCPAWAQQTIQFSKPAKEAPAPEAPALKVNSDAPATPNVPSTIMAPRSLFGNGPSFDVLPMGPMPIVPNGNAAQWQKKKDWSLMTPEQILGIPTPESILGIADSKEDPKLSPEEQFMQREERQSQMEASNVLRNFNASFLPNQNSAGGVLGTRDDRNGQDGLFGAGDSHSTMSTAATDLNPFAFGNPRVPAGANVNQQVDPTWVSPFGSAAPPQPVTPQQLAGMERFRALFESPPAAAKPATASFFVQPAATPDPYLQQSPAFNPVGQAVKPLESGVVKPVGLTPLAGIATPPSPKKASLVQPPPWLSQSPDNPTLPQRQF